MDSFRLALEKHNLACLETELAALQHSSSSDAQLNAALAAEALKLGKQVDSARARVEKLERGNSGSPNQAAASTTTSTNREKKDY